MRRRTDQEIKDTGWKAFRMMIELTSLLITAGKDTRTRDLLEKGYKEAQNEWTDDRPKFPRRPAPFRGNRVEAVVISGGHK
jgi:hypothetical protein